MLYSVNSYSSASSRKGVSGLMSGLDTDELVKQMTMSTRSKIATQLQKKQQTQWKQEAYREITIKINDFQKKYLTYSAGSSNILSRNFFKTSNITNDSKYVKVSGSAETAKNIVIKDIDTLAATESFTTSKRLSSQNITTGTISPDWTQPSIAGSSIMIKYGGETHNIAVAKDFAFSSETLTDEQRITEIADSLNQSVLDNEKLAIKDGGGAVTGGKISFGIDGGVLKITNTSGDGTNLELTGGGAGLLEGLGLNTSLASGTTITGEAMDNTKLFEMKNLGETLAGSTLTVGFNGVDKTITFNETDKALYSDAESLKNYMQSAINKAFGNSKVTVTNDLGKLGFQTTDDTSIFSVKGSDKADVMGKNGALKMDAGISNRVSWNTKLKDMGGQMGTALSPVDGKYKLKINDVNFEFTEDSTLNDIISKINSSDAGVTMKYSTTTDTLSLTSNTSGVQGKINIADSGDSNDLAQSLFGLDTDRAITQGSDAKINVSFDGGKTFASVTRSSNTFSLDGVNFELLGKAEGAIEENITFGAVNNVDDLVTKITEFVKDYNEIVKISNDRITERPAKGYSALTDEQKEEMSEKEIENWEAKAKEGLLSNDSHLSRMLTNFRSALNGSVDGTSSALFKIGIKSTGWQDNGQLQIDETMLRKSLAENPEEVTKLFTNINETDPSKSGIATRLSDLMNANAGTFGGNGILISVAGKKGDSSNGQDRLSVQMRQMDLQLNNLKSMLKTQEDRYYKQFTTLETYLSKMNAQSSWFESQSSN